MQISRQRPDGWAYGNIILDELENQGLDAAAPVREASSAGLAVSTDAGWFPLAALDNAGITSKNISPELLNALQSKMGGAGDAATALGHWVGMQRCCVEISGFGPR